MRWCHVSSILNWYLKWIMLIGTLGFLTAPGSGEQNIWSLFSHRQRQQKIIWIQKNCFQKARFVRGKVFFTENLYFLLKNDPLKMFIWYDRFYNIRTLWNKLDASLSIRCLQYFDSREQVVLGRIWAIQLATRVIRLKMKVAKCLCWKCINVKAINKSGDSTFPSTFKPLEIGFCSSFSKEKSF